VWRNPFDKMTGFTGFFILFILLIMSEKSFQVSDVSVSSLGPPACPAMARRRRRNLYGFCSDYAGVRHGGRPTACTRALDQKDCVLTCLLLLTFSGYLTPGVDAQEILGSWPRTGSKRTGRVFLPQMGMEAAAKHWSVFAWPTRIKRWFNRS